MDLHHDPSGRGCAIAGRVMAGDEPPTISACDACLTDEGRADLIHEAQPCGCNWSTRCDVHAAMMRRIREAYDLPDRSAVAYDRFHRVWALSDGYGSPGLVPAQGYDWSGIRDSSVSAVEAMWREAVR